MEGITLVVKQTDFQCHNDIHPLHMCLSFHIFQHLFEEKAMKNESIASMQISRSMNMYVVIHPVKILEGKTYLSVTKEFLNHYGLTDLQTVSLRSAEVFSLRRVIFGAKTWAAFMCLKEDLVNGSLMRDLHLNKGLCRQGDVFLLSNINTLKFQYSDVILCECIPYHQGYISAKTSIMLICLENESMPFYSLNSDLISHKSLFNYPRQIQMNYRINDQYDKMLLDQLDQVASCSNKVYVNILPNCPFIGEMLEIYDKLSVIFVCESFLKKFSIPDKSWVKVELAFEDNNTLNSHTLDYSQVQKGFNFALDVNHYPSAVYDEECSQHSSGTSQSGTPIHLTHLNSFRETDRKLSDEAKKDLNEGPKSDDFFHERKRRDSAFALRSIIESVQPKTNFGSKTISKKVQTVQIVSLCEDNRKHLNMALFHNSGQLQAFITPLVWFNLNHQPAELIQNNAQIVITRYFNDDVVDRPKYARSIHVMLIKSPEYGNNINMEKTLAEHFASQRVVHTKNLFAIYSGDDPAFMYNYEDFFKINSPVIYLRVEKINDQITDGAALVSDMTSIYQVQDKGFDKSYVPRMMETFLLNLPLHPIWESPLPSGFLCYVLHMKNIILPFLKDCHSFGSKMPPTVFISGYEGAGKATVARAVAKLLNLHIKEINCYSMNGDTTAATESRIIHAFDRALEFTPCIALFKDVHAIGKNRDAPGFDLRAVNTFIESVSKSYKDSSTYPIIIVGTGLLPSCHPSIRNVFIHHINMKCPTSLEKMMILEGLLSDVCLSVGVPLESIAEKCPGFFLKDLHVLVSEAKKIAYERLMKVRHEHAVMTLQEEEDLCLAGICILPEDFNSALEKVQAAHSEAIGAPKIPDVTWKNVGGLEDVKKEILDTIQLPLQNPSLLNSGLQRSGVLLFGPPGTGKTLLAKAVAHECSLNFFSVKGPELIDPYVGQSEANIRDVFKQARNAAPCVIFFDELDSLAPSRGKNSDAGGVINRIVSQLLAEMDGINKASEVFIIGATNRPDLLDPALLRPGRFDCRLYVGISQNKEDQLKILNALTKDFSLSPDVDFNQIIEECSLEMTGADFYALCCDAMMNSISRIINDENLDFDAMDKAEVIVSSGDFKTALEHLKPSVSLEELENYERIRYDLQNA